MGKDLVKVGTTINLNAPVDVQEIKNELEQLGASFSTKMVVQAASSPASPLHKYFEWNDGIAADKFRLQQARNLIIVVGESTSEGPRRLYESVVINDQRVYTSIDIIAESVDLTEQLLAAALREAIFFKNKHQRLEKYLGNIFDAINQAEQTFKDKNGKTKENQRRKRSKSKNSEHSPSSNSYTIDYNNRG